MFQPTHRYVGIGALGGIAPGAQVVIVAGDGDKTSVQCADDSRWIVLTEYVVPLEVASHV